MPIECGRTKAAEAGDMRALRIAATPHVEHYTLGLYGELASRARITLVTLRRFDLPVDQVVTPRVPLPRMRTLLRDLALRSISGSVNVVHANCSAEGMVVPQKDKLVVTEHGFPDPSVVEESSRWFYVKERASLLKLAELGVPIVAISNFTAKELREKLGVTASAVIYHGVLDIFRAQAPRTHPKRHIILWNSRLVRFKEPRVLLEAVEKLRGKASFSARLRGDGPLKREIKVLIERRGLSGTVSLSEPVPFRDLPSLYSSATIYVHTCSREPFGLAVLEAMASGLPVVVPKSGGAYEVAGSAALPFEPGDSSSLAEQLLALMEDPELYEKMSERSIRRADEFSWKRAAEEYLALYERVAR